MKKGARRGNIITRLRSYEVWYINNLYNVPPNLLTRTQTNDWGKLLQYLQAQVAIIWNTSHLRSSQLINQIDQSIPITQFKQPNSNQALLNIITINLNYVDPWHKTENQRMTLLMTSLSCIIKAVVEDRLCIRWSFLR